MGGAVVPAPLNAAEICNRCAVAGSGLTGLQASPDAAGDGRSSAAVDDDRPASKRAIGQVGSGSPMRARTDMPPYKPGDVIGRVYRIVKVLA